MVFPLRAQVSDRRVIPCWLRLAFLFDEQLGSGRRRDLWKPQLLIGKGDVTSRPRSSSGCGSELRDQALVCSRAATKERRVYPPQCSICAAPFQEKTLRNIFLTHHSRSSLSCVKDPTRGVTKEKSSPNSNEQIYFWAQKKKKKLPFSFSFHWKPPEAGRAPLKKLSKAHQLRASAWVNSPLAGSAHESQCMEMWGENRGRTADTGFGRASPSQA